MFTSNKTDIVTPQSPKLLYVFLILIIYPMRILVSKQQILPTRLKVSRIYCLSLVTFIFHSATAKSKMRLDKSNVAFHQLLIPKLYQRRRINAFLKTRKLHILLPEIIM